MHKFKQSNLSVFTRLFIRRTNGVPDAARFSDVFTRFQAAGRVSSCFLRVGFVEDLLQPSPRSPILLSVPCSAQPRLSPCPIRWSYQNTAREKRCRVMTRAPASPAVVI